MTHCIRKIYSFLGEEVVDDILTSDRKAYDCSRLITGHQKSSLQYCVPFQVATIKKTTKKFLQSSDSQEKLKKMPSLQRIMMSNKITELYHAS